MTTISITKDQFNELIRAFRKTANAKQLHPHDIIAYNLIRGLPTNRGFTPITNRTKLDNGRAPNGGFYQARADLMWHLHRSRSSWIASLSPECKEFLQAIAAERL